MSAASYSVLGTLGSCEGTSGGRCSQQLTSKNVPASPGYAVCRDGRKPSNVSASTLVVNKREGRAPSGVASPAGEAAESIDGRTGKWRRRWCAVGLTGQQALKVREGGALFRKKRRQAVCWQGRRPAKDYVARRGLPRRLRTLLLCPLGVQICRASKVRRKYQTTIQQQRRGYPSQPLWWTGHQAGGSV